MENAFFFWYRFFSILPGLVTWIILIMPVALAFYFPELAAIFITIYVLLWFIRSLKLSIFLIYAYRVSKKYEKRNWAHLLDFFTDNPPVPRTNCEHKTAAQTAFLRKNKLFKKWTDIYHVLIIATYKEEKEILESTIESIKDSVFPHERIIVVLATEERDQTRAQQNADYLLSKFKNYFGEFYHVMHPSNLPGEIIGKGPNITYACKKITAVLRQKNIDPSNVLVTTLDADNRPHQAYLSDLTYHYLMEAERNRRSYQPLPFFYNNIWDVPVWNRLVALASSFWHLGQSVQIDTLKNFSSHAQSLDALIETNYWSTQTIVEDGHQFWRSFLAFNGNHSVIPLFVPIYQDAVQNKTYFSTLRGQYVQLRRWAWGVSDIPFVLINIWKKRKNLPFLKTVFLSFQLVEGHIMWATAPIVVTFSSYIPKMINRDYSHSLFFYNLNQILSVYFLIAMVGILVSLWISLLTLPKHPRSRWWSVFWLIQWLLLPLVTIFFGAIPSIDAQTRLMLNKPLEFTVTEKIRRAT